MIKRIGRRFVSLLLTFVTILTLLPAMTLPALAATSGTVIGLADEKIGLSFVGDVDDAWQIKNANVIGQAKSSTGDACNTINHNSTLTITNNKSTTATLSFDYAVTVNGGTIQVDGITKNANGKFTKELQSGGEVKVNITSGSTDNPTTITISNIKLIAQVNATVTFLPAENGSYTVGEKAITTEWASTESSTTTYQVKATPDEGYRFIGWYDVTKGSYINANATAALNFDSDCTITARFGSIDLALFETNGLNFDNLSEAVIEAKKNPSATITLVSDGKITRNYTIPYGVTLLIPFDDKETLYTTTPESTTTEAPQKAYKTLTMAAGSSITLENGAALSVGGQYFASQGGQSGKMVGPYGCIKMESDSAITVQNGASLYAWGFISGSGSVTVQSGGSVYEWYQILDFRGGTATTKIAASGLTKGVFPLSQYTVQNVEVPLTVHAGASETVYTAVLAKGEIYPTPIQFIGNNGMFKLTSGSLTKTYDGDADRLIYTINGKADVNSLTLTLAGVDLDSGIFVLPFTSNMTVVLKSGSKLTMNQTAALLPSVSVTIEKNAELLVASGKELIIYDVIEWGDYCFSGGKYVASVSVPFAPGRRGKRAPLTDAKIDVNGTLTAEGHVYTTASGANLYSSKGGGRFVQQGTPGQEKTTYQVKKHAGKLSPTEYASIPITPAQLKNKDGSYTKTSTASASDTFTYCKCQECGGKWTNGLKVAEIDENDGKLVTTHETLKEAVGKLEDGQYIKMLHNTTEDITANKNLYLDLNGRTVTGNFTMNDNTLFYGMDSTTDGYDGTNAGKIVGSVAPYAKTTYQTPPVPENVDDGAYKRYVAISGKEADGKANLSFHRFNISVTGYRFELAAPECALFFIGKFQGDAEAKKHLTSLGFTLTDIAGETTNPRYDIPDVEKIPSESNPGESPVVLSSDGAFLFEAYLIREIDKGDSNTYQKQFSATAKATFNNSGVQDEDNSRSSVERKLSFQQALWDALSAPDMEEKDKKILMNFLNDMNIPNPNPNP